MSVSDAELVDCFPDRIIDDDNQRFYRGWLERRLMVNRCRQCGFWHHPPKPICPQCWSTGVVPTEVGGQGVVAMFTLLRQGHPPGADPAMPYPVAAVELAEQPGLRLTSTVVDCAPDALDVGMPVKLAWIDRGGIPFPAFTPAPEHPPARTSRRRSRPAQEGQAEEQERCEVDCLWSDHGERFVQSDADEGDDGEQTESLPHRSWR